MSICGKIYCIMSPSLLKCYIGSTRQSLNKRLSQHKHQSVKSKCMSKILMATTDYNCFLIEEVICDDITILKKREGEWIEAMKDSGLLVNKVIAGRTKKDWYNTNKQLTIDRVKKRAIEKKDEIKKYQREYYLANREKLIAYALSRK